MPAILVLLSVLFAFVRPARGRTSPRPERVIERRRPGGVPFVDLSGTPEGRDVVPGSRDWREMN